MAWNDSERRPYPGLNDPELDLVGKVRALLADKRVTLKFMQELEPLFGLTEYHKGNINSLHQTIADLEALVAGI